jgi:trehalose synthase-fused probable maltokinase
MKAISHFYGEVGSVSICGPLPAAQESSARALIEPFLDSVALLARRTAELHLALASAAASQDADFSPEPFDTNFQEGFEQALEELTNRVFSQLRKANEHFPAAARNKAMEVLASQDEIRRRFHAALNNPLRALRTRIHGDYHLGQVLYTGSDFMIIDFEGEPARSMSQRRLRRCRMWRACCARFTMRPTLRCWRLPVRGKSAATRKICALGRKCGRNG